MRRTDPGKQPTFELDGVLPPDPDDPGNATGPADGRDFSYLSPFAFARWRCIEAISVFNRAGLDVRARWAAVASWIDEPLPIDRLDADDRHRIVATIILRTEEHDEYHVDRLARWLVHAGVTDWSRVNGWVGDVAVSNEVVLKRLPFVHELVRELKQRLAEARDRRGATRIIDSP
jgi:hypothetical protein